MGNRYIYVMYDYDSNAISVQAILNKQAHTIANAWENLTNRRNMNGHKYNNFVTNNEILVELKNAFKKYNIKYECVPPKIHRRNVAKRAIQTFKNHFLEGLAICDPKFTIHEWEQLLPQEKIMLNLLRQG